MDTFYGKRTTKYQRCIYIHASQCLIILPEYGGAKGSVTLTFIYYKQVCQLCRYRVTIVVNLLQCSIISVSKILQFIGNYIYYSSSSDLYSTFPSPMLDISSNFSIHQSTLIDAPGATFNHVHGARSGASSD